MENGSFITEIDQRTRSIFSSFVIMCVQTTQMNQWRMDSPPLLLEINCLTKMHETFGFSWENTSFCFKSLKQNANSPNIKQATQVSEL